MRKLFLVLFAVGCFVAATFFASLAEAKTVVIIQTPAVGVAAAGVVATPPATEYVAPAPVVTYQAAPVATYSAPIVTYRAAPIVTYTRTYSVGVGLGVCPSLGQAWHARQAARHARKAAEHSAKSSYHASRS